jgi:protein-disulfide isomerase
MHSTIRTALLCLTLVAPVAVIGALVAGIGASASPPQDGTAVRDYLLAHPEVVEEAMAALDKKREAETLAKQASAIETQGERIFNSEHQAVLGNPDGAITLVEFFDYNCGYCKRAEPDMTALIEANPDLRVVLKEFPILAQGSVEAARISVAVKDLAPASYLEFHRQLLLSPGAADGRKALSIATSMGLDSKALLAAANTPEVTENLAEAQQLASELGISGTPSYIIANAVVPGARGYDALQGMVNSVRKCGATVC